MIRSFRSKLTASVAALVLVSMAGCGSDSEGASDEPDASTIPSGEALKGRTLNIVSWGGDFTDATKEFLTDPFSKETGVEVKFTIAGADTTAPVILQEQQGKVTIDMIDSGKVGVMLMNDYAAKFPKDLMDVFEETLRPGTFSEYNMSYANTTTFIVCNPDMVKKCPTNGKEFFDVKNFPGSRALPASANSDITFALLADGVPADSLFPLDIDRAIKKLNEIKPHIKVWPSSGDMQQQVMIDKEVGISLMWSPRAFRVQQDHLPNLEFYWDDSVTFAGGALLPKGAPNTDVAFAYLKWVAEHPKQQAKWATKMASPMPSKQLAELLPPDIAAALPASHDTVYLDDAGLAKQSDEIKKAWQAFLVN